MTPLPDRQTFDADPRVYTMRRQRLAAVRAVRDAVDHLRRDAPACMRELRGQGRAGECLLICRSAIRIIRHDPPPRAWIGSPPRAAPRMRGAYVLARRCGRARPRSGAAAPPRRCRAAAAA